MLVPLIQTPHWMATNKKDVRKRRTISPELFAQWRACMRSGDAAIIAGQLEVSKPTIDNALGYGHVLKQTLVDGITKYFADRLMKERDDALMLKDLKLQSDRVKIPATT